MCLHKHALFYLTSLLKPMQNQPGVVVHAYNPELRSQRQEVCHKFKVSLVYGELQASRVLRVNPVLDQTTELVTVKRSLGNLIKQRHPGSWWVALLWENLTVESPSALTTLLWKTGMQDPEKLKDKPASWSWLVISPPA